MKLDKNIYIVIPAFNEGTCIKNTITTLLQKQFTNVIVIDDGSEEDIRGMLQDLPIFYIRHKINLGQGAALQTGFDFAKERQADIIITFDADGQHDVKDLEALIAPLLSDRCDVVLGSRFLNNKASSTPFVRKIILKTARFINFCFCGIWLTDAHNGLRAFNKKAISAIEIEQNRMAHASEILFQIRIHKLKFEEVPATIHYSAYSQQKGQKNIDSISVLFDLLLLKLFK
jgi:polyprenyl-phospho-N-acetylgalactosaminyl synthase